MHESSTGARIWEGVDRLLLALVFALLAWCWWEVRPVRAPAPAPLGRSRATGLPAPRRAAVPSLRVSEAASAALARDRMTHIARELAESTWEAVPASPAADMREQNGGYDILFTLPDTMDPASVKVSTSGNVLTLFVSGLGNPKATFVKQFYIPCGAERAGPVQTTVSNDIVRVRIQPPNS